MERIVYKDEIAKVSIMEPYYKVQFENDVYIMRDDTTGLLAPALANELDSTELVSIKRLAEAEGRYGGPATMCQLTFKLPDDRLVTAYFAQITQAQHNARDTTTAVTMPLPWMPL